MMTTRPSNVSDNAQLNYKAPPDMELSRFSINVNLSYEADLVYHHTPATLDDRECGSGPKSCITYSVLASNLSGLASSASDESEVRPPISM